MTAGAAISKVTYHIVQHDAGWAYKVDETFSELFSTHDQAREAAELAGRCSSGGQSQRAELGG